MFDERGMPAYFLMIGAMLVSAAIAFVFRLQPTFLASLAIWTWPFVFVGGLLSRRIGLPRLALALEGTGLLFGQGLCLLLALYGMATTNLPYADPLLARWDEALGFHWPSYVRAMLPYSTALTVAYRSFGWQPFIVVIGLVLAKRDVRLWTLLVAAMIASALTAAIFPFFPAVGAFEHYGLIADGYTIIPSNHFSPALDYFRGGGRVIEPSVMTGLVPFPSYHSAEAVLFAWAAWSVRYVRWPLLILNCLVLISTPVNGAHYLVDVLAGVAIAAVAIFTAKSIMRRWTWRLSVRVARQYGAKPPTS